MLLPIFKKTSAIMLQIPRRPIVFSSDIAFTLLAILSTQWVKSPATFHPLAQSTQTLALIFMILTMQAVSYWLFGLYRGVWRFASIPDLIRIIKACLTGSIALACMQFILQISPLLSHLSLPLFFILTVSFLCGTRLTYRWYKDNNNHFKVGEKVLVIGAGNAGESIIRELKRNTKNQFCPIGFIDDDFEKLGREIHGIRVLGNTQQLNRIVKEHAVTLILIAIPTANAVQMRQVVNLCEQTNIPYRTLPNLNDIASGKATINHIRPVLVEDLLSRDPIQFNRSRLAEFIGKKKILITGAGGSIGSEICRKIAECEPECVILIEHSEFNLFQIQTELTQAFPNLSLHCYLISITNKEMVSQIMRQHKPHYVFHAAAYKHVPLLEPQIRVAIDNNIFGTQIVASAAIENNVQRFIMVSTDKAVNPTNIMGATKRCAEIICQCLNKQNITKFITVRFGNVLGSTGSVVPLFKQQIAKGGPLTITHPEMERYFMTIQEAAQLVIETVTLENPADLYVLDMGEPIKIRYLAEQMIKLSGQQPDIDIKIIYTGLRPGEKINEELFCADEKVSRTDNEKIMRVDIPPVDSVNYIQHLTQLKASFLAHDDNLRQYLFDLAGIKNLHTLPSQSTQPVVKRVSVPLAIEYI